MWQDQFKFFYCILQARKAKLLYHKNGASGKLANSHSHSEPSYTTIATQDSARALSVSDSKLQDSLSSSAVSMQISTVITPTENKEQVCETNKQTYKEHTVFVRTFFLG